MFKFDGSLRKDTKSVYISLINALFANDTIKFTGEWLVPGRPTDDATVAILDAATLMRQSVPLGCKTVTQRYVTNDIQQTLQTPFTILSFYIP
jgi:hypothetical protein